MNQDTTSPYVRLAIEAQGGPLTEDDLRVIGKEAHALLRAIVGRAAQPKAS